MKRSAVVEIAASPEAVWDMIANGTDWPYVEVTRTPDGPLQVGTLTHFVFPSLKLPLSNKKAEMTTEVQRHGEFWRDDKITKAPFVKEGTITLRVTKQGGGS